MARDYLALAEACEILATSAASVRSLAESQRIRIFFPQGRWPMYNREDVERVARDISRAACLGVSDLS